MLGYDLAVWIIAAQYQLILNFEKGSGVSWWFLWKESVQVRNVGGINNSNGDQ